MLIYVNYSVNGTVNASLVAPRNPQFTVNDGKNESAGRS